MGWDRDRCIEEIRKSDLAEIPKKSSCYFGPAMKPAELHRLTEDKLRRIVMIEARPHQRQIDHADAKRDEINRELRSIPLLPPSERRVELKKKLKKIMIK